MNSWTRASLGKDGEIAINTNGLRRKEAQWAGFTAVGRASLNLNLFACQWDPDGIYPHRLLSLYYLSWASDWVEGWRWTDPDAEDGYLHIRTAKYLSNGKIINLNCERHLEILCNAAIALRRLNPGESFRESVRTHTRLKAHAVGGELNGTHPAFSPNGIKVHWPAVVH